MTPHEVTAAVVRALHVDVHEVRVLDGGEFNVSVLLDTGAGLLVARSPRYPLDWRSTLAGQAAAMELARGRGVPVPEVVHVDNDVMVYRYVPGEPLFEDAAAGGLAFAAGEAYAALHAIEGAGTGPVLADGSSSNWSSRAYFDGVAVEVDHLLRTHQVAWGIDAGAVERAAVLLQSPPPLRFRLVHGDAGLGNVIVEDDAIAALIDFDNVWYGDPAIDLAWWWWRSPATADAFEAGCAANGDHTTALVKWSCRVRLLVGLADIFAARMPLRAHRIGQLLNTAVHELAYIAA